MRVCVLTTCYPRYRGDPAGCFVESLLSRLRASFPVEPVVVAPHEKGLACRERRDGIEIRRFRYAWPSSLERVAYREGIPDNIKRDWAARVQLPTFMAAFLSQSLLVAARCDLIHANWVETAFLGLPVSRAVRSPLVTTVHSLAPKGGLEGLYRRVLRGSDYVLFNSSFTAQRAGQLNAQCRGEVLFQGTDVHRFAVPRTGEFRRRLGVGDDELLAVSVGRLIECKGHIVLIRALSELAKEVAGLKVAIAGDGPLRGELARAIEAHGLGNRVHMLGQIATTAVPRLLSDADLYVHPVVVDVDGRTEAMGIAVCEAMAAGLPCVVSRAGGLPELVGDQEHGILVEPGDAGALARALKDIYERSELRARLGAAARKRAAEVFSWDAIAARTFQVYESVVHGSLRCGLEV